MENKRRGPFVALGRRLEGVPEVITLGVRANFADYAPREQDLLRSSDAILYPTRHYAQYFATMGRRIFPSLETHLYADEKIKQSTLFQLLQLPHPRTMIYYHLHHDNILDDFEFPFVAKVARASAQGRGVFKIQDELALGKYLRTNPIAYIQEYLPHRRDLRVILINYEPVVAYWRQNPPGEFRSNLLQGGTIQFDVVPRDAIELAQTVARECRFDDVGLDLIECEGVWYVIEANMLYGRQGLRSKGLDLKEIIRAKLLAGELITKTRKNENTTKGGDEGNPIHAYF
jgi:ribosomal protein S6--L-glutamate ligase